MEVDPLLDTVVGDRYRIIRKIAEGGMSAIYEVQHTKVLRTLALKLLLPELMHIEEARERFVREAELLGSLNHPNVVEVTDWVELADGTPCMILEFLHGNSLQVRLQRGALQWDAIARIGDQTMSALQLAHRNGITHRDLKPENIFISIDDSGDERVKLLDFGVSKLRGVDRLSGVHRMLGTPSYMSPEQAASNAEAIGPSTDVWAMGTILYEMATQQTAYKAPEVGQTLTIILEGKPPPIKQYRKDAPEAFIKLVGRAISHDPAQRITTVEDLRAGLRAALEPKNAYRLNTPVAGVPITVAASEPLVSFAAPVRAAPSPSTPPVTTVTMIAPPKRKTWLWVAIVALLVTALNVALALLLR